MVPAVWVRGDYKECAVNGFEAIENREIDSILTVSNIKAQSSCGYFSDMLCKEPQGKAVICLWALRDNLCFWVILSDLAMN